MTKRVYILAHQTARDRAANDCLTAPTGFVVTVSEPSRNLEQNALLHATISDIAARRKWAGVQMDVDAWKRLLTCAWMRATGQNVTLVPALDGAGFDVLYRHTSKLSKSECSELIDYIQAWDATHEPVPE